MILITFKEPVGHVDLDDKDAQVFMALLSKGRKQGGWRSLPHVEIFEHQPDEDETEKE